MSPPVELLTFEDLTEVYRREQRSKNITEVRRDFYAAVRECHERLRRESEREFAVDQFSTRSKLASNQLMKFQEKAAQVFEFRMEKILAMALRAAGGNKIDPGKLTVEERELFDKVSSLLKDRHAVLLQGSRPRTAEPEEPSLDLMTPPMVAEAEREDEMFDPSPAGPELPPVAMPGPPADLPATSTPLVPPPLSETVLASPQISAPDLPPIPVNEAPAAAPPAAAASALADRPAAPPDHVVLRILEDMPPIAGPGRNYRLNKEDVVCLPPNIAKALLARKKAVKVQLDPLKTVTN